MSDIVKFENVVKEYKSGEHILTAIDHINFTIEEGEFVVILGPSGAGKSTLLNLLGGLDTVTSGKIIVDGNNIESFNDNQLTRYRAKNVGFIFQFYNLIPNLTALENVELMKDIVDVDIDGMKVLASVGLDRHANQFPSQLSGGEQQRVSIARAVAKKPAMLLCDEPTGALDSRTGVSILSLLQDINKKLNITIIMVTHQMEVIKQICSRVAIMEGGKVLEIGNTEELFLQNSKNLQKLVGEDEIVLPKGSNIRIIFPKEISNESIITSMARNLDIDFSIVCGRLEKYREDILGSLIINVSSKHKEKVKKYLDERHVRWEEIINED